MVHCCRSSSQKQVAVPLPSPSSASSSSVQQSYLKTLESLEGKEKLFAAHDLLDEITPKTIESFIDVRIKELLGCNLKDLKDEGLANRICRAFFKQKEIVKEWKHHSQLPLFEGLLLAYIFNKMRKIFTKIHEDQIVEGYSKLRDKIDSECADLLTICFRDSEEKTRVALETNYHPFIHAGECVSYSSHRIRLMEIAYMGKAHKFLAHPACQKAIDRRWQPSYRIGQTSVWVYVYYFLPFLLFIKKTEPSAKDLGDTRWVRLKKFYASPASKYVLHMASRFVYVLGYSAVLIRLSRRNLHQQNIEDFIEVFFIMGWQCSYLFEMLAVACQSKWWWWAERNQVDFIRNVLISANVVCLVCALLPFTPFLNIRFALLPLADLFFYLSYIMAVIRSMRILYVDSFFGTIVAMIGKMVPIMLKFFFVFLFFWAAFAVCYISLSGHYRAENSTFATVPWQIFYHGAFEIFGEAIDEDKKGELPSCTGFDFYSYTDSSFHCLFRTWMVPILLFAYILISGILLVNILTALLTKQYEDLSKESHIYWKVALYTRLAEYEESIFVPAPLSLIYYLILFIIWLATKLIKEPLKWCRKYRQTSPVDQNSIEMVPLVKDLLPIPALARTSPPLSPPPGPSSISPGKLGTIVEQSESVEEERPKQLKAMKKDPVAKNFYKSHARPHSAAGITEYSMDMPTFEEVQPMAVSKPRSSEAPSPVDVIETTVEGVRAISRTHQDEALAFIQLNRDKMVNEQNEIKMQARAKQMVMAQILQRFDLTFTARQRGMTE